MAHGAVPIPWVGHVVGRSLRRDAAARAAESLSAVVAFETDSEQYRSFEKPGVGRAVREVARFASVDPDSGMFEEERPALVGVALQAWLFVGERLIDHAGARAHPPGGSGRAVRIVAVRAGHHTFVHTVLRRHVELRPDGSVAVVAEIRLLLREECLGADRAMDRMTTGTDDVVLRVFGSPDFGAVYILGVAIEAVVQDALGSQFTERDDGRLTASRFDVGFARTVASLTSRLFRASVSRRDRLIVRVLVKASPYVRMACLAHCATDILR